jgi:hypothetical protein
MKRAVSFFLLCFACLLCLQTSLSYAEATPQISGAVYVNPKLPNSYIVSWTMPEDTRTWRFQRCHALENACQLIAVGGQDTSVEAELFDPPQGSRYIVTAFRRSGFVEAAFNLPEAHWIFIPSVVEPYKTDAK